MSLLERPWPSSDSNASATARPSCRSGTASWPSTPSPSAANARDLDADPFGTVATLESLTFGIDWILHRWDDLRAPLNHLEPQVTSLPLADLWDESDQRLALVLCGLDPNTPLAEQTDDHPLA